MRPSTRLSVLSAASAVALVGACAVAQAQDNLVEYIDAATATNGAPLGAWGYDPATDSAYVASFGAGGSIRKITNATSGAAQVATVMVSEAQWNLYYRDGDPNTSAGTQVPGGLLLNPQAIGSGTTSIAPYSRAWIIDAARVPAIGTIDPARSKRLYDYNLQMVMPNPNPGKIPTTPPFYDGRDVFTTKVTLADMNAAVGQPSNATSNVSRQFAWSGDGQSIYFNDSSDPLGGIWKAGAQSGAVSRIHTDPDILTEPAVKQVSPGADRIFFRGTSATGNTTDGIDYIEHDGTNTTAAATLISGQAVRDFMETTATLSVTAIAADANGDLFFNVSGGSAGTLMTQRRNVLRYDAQGRLSKVLAYNERDLFYTGEVGGASNPTANVAKMQPRTATYAGASGTFELTQILYAELSQLNRVGGIWAFKAGDFDRDNDVDAADVALFKPELTVRGQVVADTLDLKFDLTGNNAVDWKDVKTLQQFYAFPDGDANIDKAVNLQDFNALAANFGQAGRVWTQGDFNGDEVVNLLDFNILAAHFGQRAAGPGVTPGDWANLAAAVPEPASAGTIGLFAAGLLLRRRRRRAT